MGPAAADQRLARPEEQRLDRGEREAELLGDVGVAQSLPLAQEDCLPLPVGELLERGAQLGDLLARLGVQRGRGGLELVHVRVGDMREPAAERAPRRAADVVRDRQQPRELVSRDDAAPQRPERVEERGLRRILGLFRVAQAAPAEAVDPLPVAGVQVAGPLRGALGFA